jgi:hypothetical protein
MNRAIAAGEAAGTPVNRPAFPKKRFHKLKRDMGVSPMLEARYKSDPVYSRFRVPGNEHGRDAHVTLEVAKQLLNFRPPRLYCEQHPSTRRPGL